MKFNNSFTCRVTDIDAPVARTHIDEERLDHSWSCENPWREGIHRSRKNTVHLNDNGFWERECHWEYE